MKELVVLGFASRELAEEARSVGAELDREGVLQLDGAALAYRRDDGRVELVQHPVGRPSRHDRQRLLVALNLQTPRWTCRPLVPPPSRPARPICTRSTTKTCVGGSTRTAGPSSPQAYEERLRHGIPPDDPVLFLEVTVADPSEFEARLQVTGEERHGYRILRMESSAVPNAIAAVLLHIRDRTGARPHIFFDWTEGNPVAHLLRFLIFGSGEVAPVTREVLREAEPDPQQRPFVHVA